MQPLVGGNLDLKIHACACPERVALGVGVRRERPFLGLQAFPAEAWSARAAVNRSFSEALRGGERKSQPIRFRIESYVAFSNHYFSNSSRI